MLRGDIVKDDSGASAVSTERGSSASQMTAARVMDVIARFLDCRGQTAGAASAGTQEDDPKLLGIPKSECPDFCIRLPRHKWPKSLTNIRRSSGSFRTKIFGHPLAGLLWERQFVEFPMELG